MATPAPLRFTLVSPGQRNARVLVIPSVEDVVTQLLENAAFASGPLAIAVFALAS